MSALLLAGDMLQTLKLLEPNSIDSVVTDPPYHLASIVKRFGKEGSAPAQFGKDGAFVRASKGFMGSVWDTDIAFHAETWLEVIRVLKPGGYILAFSSSRTYGRMQVALEDAGFVTHPMIGWLQAQGMPKATRLKLPGTDHLRYGGQVLKPSLEPIYVGQKPMEGTGTQNHLKYGTGCVNVDAIRVPLEEGDSLHEAIEHDGLPMDTAETEGAWGFKRMDRPAGVPRWPMNAWHDGSDEVRTLFPNGMARCFPCCPYEEGETDAAYYVPKAGKADRVGTNHATVKPQKLLRQLIRGWTPPGGTVLDCFGGSGSSALAATADGFDCILCEADPTYIQDILRRVPGCALSPLTPLSEKEDSLTVDLAEFGQEDAPIAIRPDDCDDVAVVDGVLDDLTITRIEGPDPVIVASGDPLRSNDAPAAINVLGVPNSSDSFNAISDSKSFHGVHP